MSLTFAQFEAKGSAEAFLSRMEMDADFFIRVGKAKSPADRWNLIRNEGFDFTKEHLADAMADQKQTQNRSLATIYGALPGTAAQGDIPRPDVPNPKCGTCE